MASTVRIVVNSRGIGQILKSDDLGAELLKRAERVADRAKSTAPRSTDGNGVTYAEHIDAWVHKGPTRVVGRAGAHVVYAQQVEARHRTLGRAIDAAGGP